MENEVPILTPQPIKKKRIAARVITAVLLSLAYLWSCLVVWEAFFFCELPFVLILVGVTLTGTVIQVLITRKTDAKYLEMLLPNAVCLVGSLIILIVSKGDGIAMLITAFALLALRLLLSVIDCLVRKKAKWIPLFLALSVVTACVGFGAYPFAAFMFHIGGNTENVKTQPVDSELYSQQDIDAAIETVKKEFQYNWSGCTLTEIYYGGDDRSEDWKDYLDRWDADEVIVLLSSFEVDSSGGDGSLEPDSTYDNWNWILVRKNGGKWHHVDHGY